jgi:hypothetical protein
LFTKKSKLRCTPRLKLLHILKRWSHSYQLQLNAKSSIVPLKSILLPTRWRYTVDPSASTYHDETPIAAEAAPNTTADMLATPEVKSVPEEDSAQSDSNLEWYGLDQVTLPFTTVPELPPMGSSQCVHDEDARSLQKLLLRVVKWCVKADKLRLEEFKINSRLYGNGFMDPDEYAQSIAVELGPLRILVVVPCMLRLQPDMLKKQLLYVALQSYRTKNLAKLQALVTTDSGKP